MRASEGDQPSPAILRPSLNPWVLAGTIALCPRGEGRRQGVAGPTGSQGPGQECGVRRRRVRIPKLSTCRRDLPAGPTCGPSPLGRGGNGAAPRPGRTGSGEAGRGKGPPRRSGAPGRAGRLEEGPVLCNPRRGQGAPPTDHVGHGKSKTI